MRLRAAIEPKIAGRATEEKNILRCAVHISNRCLGSSVVITGHVGLVSGMLM
jgi:hypothetical protein